MDPFPRDKRNSYVDVTVVCRVRLSPNPLFIFLIFIYMKYIISEHRLERLVNKYLSSLGFTEGNDDADGFDIMHGGSHVLAYRYEEERLYISTDLIRDVRDLFGLPQKESMYYIRNWFQNEYNTRAKTVWLLFPDEPFTY